MESTAQANKALYRRFIEEVFNHGRVEQVDEFLSADYAIRDVPPGSPSGRDGVVAIVRMFREAFPDLNIIIEDQVAEGDFVASRTVTQGTHHGPIFGVPPSHKSIAVPGLTLVKIVDGRIIESSVKNDMLVLLRQIGATSLP